VVGDVAIVCGDAGPVVRVRVRVRVRVLVMRAVVGVVIRMRKRGHGRRRRRHSLGSNPRKRTWALLKRIDLETREERLKARAWWAGMTGTKRLGDDRIESRREVPWLQGCTGSGSAL
jgi:hypothetical protein